MPDDQQASLIQQLGDITGCNHFQAEHVLKRCNWDFERAVNSFFDDPPPENPSDLPTSAASNAVAPFRGGDGDADAIIGWNGGPSSTYQAPIGPPPAPGSWSPNPKQDGVIDLTGEDGDEDLKRAMAASLQDQEQAQRYQAPPDLSNNGVSSLLIEPMASTMIEQPSPLREGTDRSCPISLGDTGSSDVDPEIIPSNRLRASSRAQRISPKRTRDQPSSSDSEYLDTKDAEKSRRDESGDGRAYSLRDRSKVARPRQGIPLSLTEAGGSSGELRGSAQARPPRRTYKNRRGGGDSSSRRGKATTQDGMWEAGWGWEMDVRMTEDEQLRQALEASVMSHHESLQGNGSGARTPILPGHLELGERTRRPPNAPVALVAPFVSLEVVAASLQALYAAPPARHAFLTSRPADPRTKDLTHYWKGASPSSSTNDDTAKLPPGSIQASFDLTQRIQTLFGFMTSSQRSICVVKDVASLAPSEVVARGADNSAPLQVASLFHDFVFERLAGHVAMLKKETENIANTDGSSKSSEWLGNALDTADQAWMDDRLFMSTGAAALTTPPTPPDDGTEGPASAAPPRTPGIEKSKNSLRLRHDSINTDIFSCLRASLAIDGEGALLTRPAKVLCLAIEHVYSADGAPPPLRINPEIYLDSLMWDRRKGLRLDSDLFDGEMAKLNYVLAELQTRKRKLMGESGKVSIDLLSETKRYFEELALADQDALRGSMLTEAGPQMTKIIDAVQKDISATESLISQVQGKIDQKRAVVQGRARKEAENAEWQQLKYELSAVLCQDGLRVVCFVRQPDDSWWKVVNGKAEEVAEEEVTMGRSTDPSLGVFWVVYSESQSNPLPTKPEESTISSTTKVKHPEQFIPETIQSAIQDDNLTLESELLSLMRSDGGTPTVLSTGDEDKSDTGVAMVEDAASSAAEDVTISKRSSET